MKRVLGIVLGTVLLLFACALPSEPLSDAGAGRATAAPVAIPAVSPAQHPFPRHVSYAANSLLPDQRSQKQLEEDVGAFDDQGKADYLVPAGTSPDGTAMFRVAFGKAGPARAATVSEGQGYGLVIVALMAGYDPDAQAIFDGLWALAQAHPSDGDPRLMDWKIPDAGGDNSAFDGDGDIALGLLLADAQWGSTGAVDYLAAAENVIAGLRQSAIGVDSRLPLLGDWVEQDGAVYNQYTPRASDFMLVNFRAFSAATGDAIWDEVISQSQQVALAIQAEFSPATGLLPDFIVKNGPGYRPADPNFLENESDGAYGYNAGRVPWRVGLDALLYGDASSGAIVRQISDWVEADTAGDPALIRAGYRLDGTPLPGSDYFTTFFVAPMGVAAMSNPAQQLWLNAIYESIYDRHEDYYEDSVTLLCLLVMSGNFWVP